MLAISEGIDTCLSDSAIDRSARSASPEWREVVDRAVFFFQDEGSSGRVVDVETGPGE
jgi:hypothetical protein